VPKAAPFFAPFPLKRVCYVLYINKFPSGDSGVKKRRKSFLTTPGVQVTKIKIPEWVKK
jgi:hypothetical protein